MPLIPGRRFIARYGRRHNCQIASVDALVGPVHANDTAAGVTDPAADGGVDDEGLVPSVA